jgi:hypothetical protein
MKEKDFNNLTASIREAGRIKRGQAKPARVTQFTPIDVKTIRHRLGKPKSK